MDNQRNHRILQRCLVLVITGWLVTTADVSGHTLRTLHIDSTARSTEFYFWTYDRKRNPEGFVQSYWRLDKNDKLFLGKPSHQPPASPEWEVGSWEFQDDSITMKVLAHKRIGFPQPQTFRYKVNRITWSTNTGYTDGATGEPFILTSFAIVLSDNPGFNIMESLAELNQYIIGHFERKEPKKGEESMQDLDAHFQMEQLVLEYFNQQNIVVGIRQYRNKKLWIPKGGRVTTSD